MFLLEHDKWLTYGNYLTGSQESSKLLYKAYEKIIIAEAKRRVTVIVQNCRVDCLNRLGQHLNAPAMDLSYVESNFQRNGWISIYLMPVYASGLIV